MRTLFLGARGFVGKSLLSVIRNDKEIVLLSKKRLKNLPSTYTEMIGNLESEETLKLISRSKFECVIDCAWVGLPDLSNSNNLINLEIKKKLIKVLIESGVQEINSIGSCLEYGSLKGKVTEDMLGENLTDFAQVKLEILKLLENSGVNYRWFRPFYLIGNGQHENSLLNMAIRASLLGEIFTPREPTISYDFIDIEDAVKGMKTAMEFDSCSGIINLGSGQTNSVNDVVNLVRRNFGQEAHESERNSGLFASLDKIMSTTGWKPEIPLEVSIQKIVNKMRIGSVK
jgi:nucleoside-diphosphate-sugar epimerase